MTLNSEEERNIIKDVSAVNTNMTLDKFHARHISEDDKSFSKIVEQENIRHQQKYSWLFEKEGLQGAMKMLEYNKQEYLTDGREAVPSSWNYKAKNQLMYYPEGQDQTDEEFLGPPKEIVHENTRFPKPTAPSQQSLMLKKQSTSKFPSSSTGPDRIDLDDLQTYKAETEPQLRGFGFVLDPSPIPGSLHGDGGSPLMTWGAVEGTPVVLDETGTPKGPRFSVPATPVRDQLAHKLSSRAESKRKQDAQKRQRLLTPLSGHTPSRGSGVAFSPAARKLMTRMTSPMSGLDEQLRRSYMSPRIPSPSPALSTPTRPSFSGRTPSRTPQLVSQAKK